DASPFARLAASAALRFFFFLGRVLPYVPRKILPRLVRRSPLPIESSVFSRQSLQAAQLEQALELFRRCRHHREATHPDEPQIGERPVLLNLAQRHGLRQPPRGLQVHHRELRILLFRVGIVLRHDLCYSILGLIVSLVL